MANLIPCYKLMTGEWEETQLIFKAVHFSNVKATGWHQHNIPFQLILSDFSSLLSLFLKYIIKNWNASSVQTAFFFPFLLMIGVSIIAIIIKNNNSFIWLKVKRLRSVV